MNDHFVKNYVFSSFAKLIRSGVSAIIFFQITGIHISYFISLEIIMLVYL